jgi:hypothetical protein
MTSKIGRSIVGKFDLGEARHDIELARIGQRPRNDFTACWPLARTVDVEVSRNA